MAKKPAPATKTAVPSKKAPGKSATAKSPSSKTVTPKGGTAAARGAGSKSGKEAAVASGRTAKRDVSAAPSTVTLRQLSARLAEDHELAKRQADAVLSGLVGLMVDHLKAGDRIRIGGFGILQVRARAARQGRNPATGEVITIKASKKIAFRPAKELKEAI